MFGMGKLGYLGKHHIGSGNMPVNYAATVNPVNFDGTNDWLSRGADLTTTNGKLWTGSLWFRRTAGNGTLRRIITGRVAGSTRFSVVLNTSNLFQIFGADTGGTTRLNIEGSTAITDSDWHHAAWSVDVANASNRFIYLDGAAETLNVISYSDADIDFTANMGVGADEAGGSKFTGDLAEVQTWRKFIDLSDADNLALFIANGVPVDPDIAAASSLGTPVILLSGATATWHTNQGSGGGFTENGALTDGTGPVEL